MADGNAADLNLSLDNNQCESTCGSSENMQEEHFLLDSSTNAPCNQVAAPTKRGRKSTFEHVKPRYLDLERSPSFVKGRKEQLERRRELAKKNSLHRRPELDSNLEEKPRRFQQVQSKKGRREAAAGSRQTEKTKK